MPTELNAMLIGSKLDLSPISSAAFAKAAGQLVLLPELCIGARDDVISVVLVSRTPLLALDGQTIVLTDESASGVGLLRVLLERRYCVRARYERSHDPLDAARAGKPALLIGDHAIDARFLFEDEHIYDLGRLWHEWTGEDMVFAVWAARAEAVKTRSAEVAACVQALVDARAWGLARVSDVAARAQQAKPRPPGFYESYYRTLKFTLDAAAERGLAAFWSELRAIGEIDRVPKVTFEAAGVAR
ncbi:MAG: menaquinone biosynthesis protein [Candidatus Eremiobacteraeota bacterium]|nr:menaquinone biosynthesis protein [Candidatus Eremiobacteraeota bacterium]